VVVLFLNGTRRGRASKSDAFIVGDVLGDLPSGGRDTSAVVTLAEVRSHQAASITGASIINNGFEAVADFDAVAAIVGSDKKQGAAVVLFGAYTELLIQPGGIGVDVVAVEGFDSDDSQLRAGFVL